MTSLQNTVQNWIDHQSEEGYISALSDLMQHGCQSGMVSSLIYYTDTTAFFKEHRQEIQALATELADGCGCSIGDLLRGWDKSDPFANETTNQNLLAWFGFEETARQLGGE